MTNIIDFSKRLQDKKEDTDPDLYKPHPDYVLGSTKLIMDIHDQIRLIENYNTKLLVQSLDSNVSVLDLNRLLTLVKFIFNGILLPFTGGAVIVQNAKNIDEKGNTKWMIVVKYLDVEYVRECLESKIEPVADFCIQVYFQEVLEIADKPRLLDMKQLEFFNSKNSKLKAATIRALAVRLNTAASINGGACVATISPESDPTILTAMPFSKTNSICIAMQGNFKILEKPTA